MGTYKGEFRTLIVDGDNITIKTWPFKERITFDDIQNIKVEGPLTGKFNGEYYDLDMVINGQIQSDSYDPKKCDITKFYNQVLEKRPGITDTRFADSIPLPKSKPAPKQDDAIKCPKCGSTQISADKKGFGVGKAVVGSAIAGPVGVVAGGIGANKVLVTCLKCGHQWKAGK